ncbi:MAG: RNA polymerase sigma factor [Candidatus Kapaibacterium sp.]
MAARTLNTTPQEQGLINEIREGDQRAFKILFDRYRVPIYRYCEMMLGDRVVAEDVYQETFVAFYSACQRGEQFHSIHGYLLTVARNQCLNLLRNKKKTVPIEDAHELQYEDNHHLNDIKPILYGALQKLPAQYREAFLLFEIEGYSYSEIAEYCDIGINTVRNRIFRAKKSLRNILGSDMRENI